MEWLSKGILAKELLEHLGFYLVIWGRLQGSSALLWIGCYLIAMARIFSIMLNRSGKSTSPCLTPDLRGKNF